MERIRDGKGAHSPGRLPETFHGRRFSVRPAAVRDIPPGITDEKKGRRQNGCPAGRSLAPRRKTMPVRLWIASLHFFSWGDSEIVRDGEKRWQDYAIRRPGATSGTNSKLQSIRTLPAACRSAIQIQKNKKKKKKIKQNKKKNKIKKKIC